MISNKQTTTSSWVKYLRHAHITKAYYRGEIDADYPDYILMIDEEMDNLKDIENLLCGKMHYDKEWCRYPMLNKNSTKEDDKETRKNVIIQLSKRNNMLTNNGDMKELKTEYA